MPARTRQSQPAAVRTAAAVVLALSMGIAACDAGDSPLAPDAEPLAPGSVAPVPETPALLTAGSGPRILFSSARSGGIDIYRMDPNGNNLVRVTSFAGPEQTPAWSWDNTRIAMVRDRLDASNVSHPDIYLMNADGTGKRWALPQASSFPITNPSWSPDGTHLVVAATLGGPFSVPYLALMNIATGQMSFVNASLGGPQGFYASFDPTGKRIVYVGGNGLALETINADGTGHQVLMTSAHGNFGNPAFSPDGSRIAFDRQVLGNFDMSWRWFQAPLPTRTGRLPRQPARCGSVRSVRSRSPLTPNMIWR
jgi:Tol biopolymer transport system component